MNTLQFLSDKYNLRSKKSPINLSLKRWERFPKLINELGFTVGAEIGVDRGRFAKRICQVNPKLKLFGVDAWKLYRDYNGSRSLNQATLDRFYAKSKETLKPYNVKLIKAFSMDAVKKFANESLDFVYIDANHRYEYCMDDIKEWSKKVKKGGLVAGGDYCNGLYADLGSMETNYGVKRAVDEWIKKNNIKSLFTLTRGTMPTWVYVKV